MLPHTNTTSDVMAHHELKIVYRLQRPLFFILFSLDSYQFEFYSISYPITHLHNGISQGNHQQDLQDRPSHARELPQGYLESRPKLYT